MGLLLVMVVGHPMAAPSSAAPPVTDPSPVATWVRIHAAQRLSHSWLSVLSATTDNGHATVDARPPDAPADTPPAAAAAYAPGLMWISPGARPAQRQQLRGLLAALSSAPQPRAGGAAVLTDDTRAASPDAASTQPQDPVATARARLRQRLAAMPITGRVPLPAQDPHWLAANPHEDPELAPGDEWWLPIRPTVVRVMRTDGSDCDVPFVAGQAASAYIRGCQGATPAAREWAWLVQPDGRVQRLGLAAWNRAPEPLPAPGAWIWAPTRADDVPELTSDALARWLATQGAAGADAVPSAEQLPSAAGDHPHTADSAAHGEAAPAFGPASAMTPRQAPALIQPLAATPAGAPQPAAPPHTRAPQALASDWGVTGLLQTPTARTRPAGTVGMAVSRGYPYTRYNVVLSPYDRLEVAVRYTSISNMLYGADIAGDQSNKDKSSELKWRLLDEGYWMPALAVGLRDPGGTGLFGGEYLVANKRFGDWDVSLGLGWGYLGQRGDLPNPLARMGLRPAERQGDRAAQGGTANLGSLFSGPTALFGGVQWQLPWGSTDAPWTFRLEWDGNDYADEARPGPLPTRTGWNAGLSGRWGDAEWGLSYQRGNRWTLNLAWFGSLSGLQTPKTAVPRPPAVLPMALVAGTMAPAVEAAPAAATETAAETASATGSAAEPGAAPAASSAPPAPTAPSTPTTAETTTAAPLLAELSQHTGWLATALSTGPDHWQVQVEHAAGAYLQERVERVWAVLHRAAPPEVRRFSLELSSRQLPLLRYEVDRQTWSDARSRHIARHQQPGVGQGAPAPVASMASAAAAAATPAAPVAPVAQEPQTDAMLNPQPANVPRVFRGVNLSYQQHIGGPDGYLYALSARAFGQWAVWDGAWLQGSLNLRLLDNYEHFKYTAPSALPRVRTLLREYVTTRRLTLPNLQATQVARLSPALYGMVYAGWLEPMFAGAGAEVLYRPLNSPWALGLDLNWVRQRAVEQDLGLGDYRVLTGHLTLRWDTGWHDVVAGVSAGQYLAGDRGVTVDLSRVFGNGTRMGVWATKTNISAEQFGEGSFDKGLYFALPFDALFTRWSGSGATVAWQPLIRDGGAKLQRGASLWGLTELRDSRLQQWRSAGEAPVSPEKVE